MSDTKRSAGRETEAEREAARRADDAEAALRRSVAHLKAQRNARTRATLWEVYRSERADDGSYTLLATVWQPSYMDALAWAKRVLRAFGPFVIRSASDQSASLLAQEEWRAGC